MNPSASGWITKFIHQYSSDEATSSFSSYKTYYQSLKESGFIYGVPVKGLTTQQLSKLSFTKEEFAKVNLLHSLFLVYETEKKQPINHNTIATIVSFYKQLEKHRKNWFTRFSVSNSKEATLEKILTARLQDQNFITKKDAASLLTYALLFTDVLMFKKFLNETKNIKTEAQILEKNLITCCFLALQAKKQKNKYDILLIELFESSSEYFEKNIPLDEITSLESIGYFEDNDYLTKQFLIDLCCLAVWDDREIDTAEHQFLQQLAVVLQLSEGDVQKNLTDLKNFSSSHSKKIKLFEYEHPVKQFYRQSAATVKLLILRNKKRLQQELEESGELVILLGQSTVRDLSAEEKQKVKSQLLDICKSIPSLTIFLLPGGTVLLPLLIKFIPKLLPSSFNENRIDVKKLKK